MKKVFIVIAGVVGLLTAAAAFLLATGTGLRWALEQGLARSGMPVEVGRAEGRLIGPLSLTDVSYHDPNTGMTVTVESIELDWRPTGLFRGLLHVTRVRAAGIDYMPGRSDGSEGPAQPPALNMSLPFEVRVDSLEVESVTAAVSEGDSVRIDRVALRAVLDREALIVHDVDIVAERYRVDGAHVRLALGPELSIDGAADWLVEPEGLPAFNGTLSARGNIAGPLDTEVLLRRPFAAEANAKATDLFGAPRWSVTANVPEDVTLSDVSPDWPPLTLRGAIAARGDMMQAQLEPDLTLAFQDQRATLSGSAVLTAKGLAVERGRLQRPSRPDTVTVSGDVRWRERLPFSMAGEWQSLQGPEAAQWTSRSGRFEITGNLDEIDATLAGVVSPPGQKEEADVELDLEARGLSGHPAATGRVRVPFFHYGGITARGLAADFDVDSAPGRQSTISVKAESLQRDDRTVTEITLRGKGSPSDHEISLDGRYAGWSVETRVTGSYEQGGWQAGVQRLAALENGENGMKWVNTAPASLAVSPERADLERLCLGYDSAEICAAGRFAANAETLWNAELEATGIPLTWLATGAPEALQIEGTATARATVGSVDGRIEGEAEARVARAVVEWTGDEPVITRYENLELTATLDPSVLEASIDGTVEDSGTIEGRLTTTDPLAEDGPLRGRLSARLPSLRLLQAFVPAVGLQDGAAEMALALNGTRRKPRFDGEARIEDAVVTVPALGLRLNALNAAVTGDAEGRLRLEARADSGGGPLTATGQLGIDEAADAWRGEIRLQGEDADLVSVPRAVIAGNPDLRIALGPEGGRISGRIDFTHAMLTPDAGTPGVTISDDIVVVSDTEPEPAANPMNWHANVTIDLGEDTRFSGYGVKGRLTGAIDIDAPPQQPTRANGRIEVQDGTYTLYGRSFDIEQGSLFYSGGPVDNPGIDVRIGREVEEDLKVTLALSGPLVEPELTLSSTRPMSETDKMSYLLLGRPASEASGAEAGLLLRAAASLIPGEGAGKVPGYLRSTLGLDTVEVRSGVGETEGASVELGKYLSPRLYVSYVAGFQQTVDVFRVRYELARHWMLRAESSIEGSGGDLLYAW